MSSSIMTCFQILQRITVILGTRIYLQSHLTSLEQATIMGDNWVLQSLCINRYQLTLQFVIHACCRLQSQEVLMVWPLLTPDRSCNENYVTRLVLQCKQGTVLIFAASASENWRPCTLLIECWGEIQICVARLDPISCCALKSDSVSSILFHALRSDSMLHIEIQLHWDPVP